MNQGFALGKTCRYRISKAIERLLILLFDGLPLPLERRIGCIHLLCGPWIFLKYWRRRLSGASTQALPSFTEGQKQNISGLQKPMEGESQHTLCLRFSGGCDSSLCAVAMMERFRRVVLLTFDTSRIRNVLGFIRSDPEQSCLMAHRLMNRFPGRIFHYILPMGNQWETIYEKDYAPQFPRSDFRRVTFCPSCSMAMHLETIAFCLHQGIPCASDGSHASSAAFSYQMQHPDHLTELALLYQALGVRYILNPYYLTPDSSVLLSDQGLLSAQERRNRYLFRRSTQQYCVPIQLQSLCRYLHGLPEPEPLSPGLFQRCFTPNLDRYRQYVQKRYPAAS